MDKHVTFVHASPEHVDLFGFLVRAIDPSVKVEHVEREQLLADAQLVGPDDPLLIARVHATMTEAASSGASVVVCTSSTIGGSAERTPGHGRFVPLRIDRAMADRAVKLGPKVLVVAALARTLAPTAKLLEESAAALGTKVEFENLVVEGAWAHFLLGHRTAYVDTVVTAVAAAARHTANVIVLAQASMSSAAEALSGLGIEILSSPRLGVQSLVAQLHR